MKKRVIIGAIIFLVTVGMFFARLIPYVGLYMFDIFLGATAIICSMEFSKLLEKMGYYNYSIVIGIYPSFMYLAHMLCVLFEASILLYILIQLVLLVSVVLITYLFSVMKKERVITAMRNQKIREGMTEYSIKKSVHTLIGCIYPSIMFLMLLIVNRFDEIAYALPRVANFEGLLSLLAILLAFMIPMITDTFSMLTGMLIGGVKLVPKISPKKTVSGAVGGLVWSAIITTLLFFIFNSIESYETVFISNRIEMWHFTIIGFFGSIVCQLGDIFESYIKRQAKVKDSGEILGPHGGFLDRLDSHIFHAVYILIVFLIII